MKVLMATNDGCNWSIRAILCPRHMRAHVKAMKSALIFSVYRAADLASASNEGCELCACEETKHD